MNSSTSSNAVGNPSDSRGEQVLAVDLSSRSSFSASLSASVLLVMAGVVAPVPAVLGGSDAEEGISGGVRGILASESCTRRDCDIASRYRCGRGECGEMSSWYVASDGWVLRSRHEIKLENISHFCAFVEL